LIFWRHDLSLFKRILAENNANAHKQAVFVEAGPRHYFAAAIIDSGIELMGFCTGLYRRYPKKYQHYLDKGFFIAGDTNTNYEGASIYSPACLAIGAGRKETWSNTNF